MKIEGHGWFCAGCNEVCLWVDESGLCEACAGWLETDGGADGREVMTRDSGSIHGLTLPDREPTFDVGPHTPAGLQKELSGEWKDGETILIQPERDRPWLFRAFVWMPEKT